MATNLTNDEWAVKKGYDYFKGFTVQTVETSSITTGDYFFYTDDQSNLYYVWMDKNGDGTTDDPNITVGTGVAVDISTATIATEVASALKTALDALTYTDATYLNDLVTIKNTNNEQNSSMEDSTAKATDFTFTVLGFASENDYPSAIGLTEFRNDADGLIITEARGTPELSTKYLRNLEYRMVEFMIDEEQGRSTEEGRPIYIPRDYMNERDRTKLNASGSDGFTRRVLNV